MEDDTPVFSLVLLAKEKWDKILTSNDLIRIKAIPDRTKGEPDNPYIMVGLISDIHKEGEYDEGILLYRITGRAMPKALIDFDVGVIREVSTVISDNIGWLPDGTEHGLNFSGNTAAGIGEELMERFVYKYAEYNFDKGKKLKDFFTYQFSSWENDESLADVTPFVNYEGSLRQFLEDVTAKPFNELFFEYTKDGKCAALMRPTPFDPDKWRKLHTYKITSDVVVEESFGKSDSEMFSVYVVQAPNIVDFNSMDLGVFPKYHPELIKKYGYRRLDAENRYLLTGAIVGNIDPGEGAIDGGEIVLPLPSYEDIMQFINTNNFGNAETLRTQRNMIYTELIGAFPSITDSLANNIIDSLIDGQFTRESYSDMRTSTGDVEKDREINKEKEISKEKLERFTNKLFNWYCENANFYSGDIRVIGNPTYRVGSRLLYEDFEQGTTWEFYVESVQHEFSFTNGYTTILGVTRGLPEKGKWRFSNLWGKAEEFKGGYLGEMSLEDLLAQAREAQHQTDLDFSGVQWGVFDGGEVAIKALNTALEMEKRPSTYVFGGGRTGKNPFLSNPIKIDCSAFIWWCYYSHGVSLKGGKTGMTTDTIKTDSRLITVSNRGSSKVQAKQKMARGDLVYFDTYKGDGHIGIYMGDGKFVGSQSSTGIAIADMNSGYWWDKFNGRVLRYGG